MTLLDDPALIGEKVQEEAEEVARAAREETDDRVDSEAADVLYHLLVLLRSRGRPLARRRGGAACPPPLTPTPRRCSIEPSLEEVRELARDHDLVPLRHTFIDDCETPVSAFLKLRGSQAGAPGVPAGVRRAGPAASGATRSSACARAASCAGRWATRATRTRSAERGRRAAPGDVPRRAAVLRRRRRLLRLRPRAHGRDDARRAQPGRARAARHGAHALRRARDLRPPQAHGHDPRQRRRRRRRGVLRRRAWPRSGKARGLLDGPVPRPDADRPPRPVPTFESNMPREGFEDMVERIVEYVHAGDAFQVVPSQRWSARARGRRPVQRLPRAAGRQPVAVHVLPGLPGLPGRGRLARAAADRHRPPRVDASRSPAPGRSTRIPTSCSPTRRSAPST